MNLHNFTDKYAEAKKKFTPSKWTKYVLGFSGTIILVGLIMFIVLGFNLGMDFTGGNIVKIETGTDITTQQYNEIVNQSSEILNEQGIALSRAQSQGETGDISISIQYQNKAGVQDMTSINNTIVLELEEAFPDYNIVSAETVSATSSSELLMNALLAIVIALIFIMIYIAFRFEFLSGVAALVTLFHDVLIMCACVVIFRIEINSAFVAAVITVLGYSINNTIIIFDRVRENLRKPSLEHLSNREIADLSVKQTLNRTLNTSITTIVSIFFLACIGVPEMSEFVVPILIGLIAGTYASIFISAPLWTGLMSKSNRNGIRKKAKIKEEKAESENAVVDAVAEPVEK
ncbi:MAG: protein translocase subunit SecF [Clostridia bacterium]|nr:protein translocase subunit SecF [Clostridia bacterium]